MYFLIDGSKVICSHRDINILGVGEIIEQSEEGLSYAAYPEKLKVVDGVVMDKTSEEIEADVEAARIASIKEIRKLWIRKRLRELGKEEDADAILDSNANMKKDWQDSIIIRTDDADLLALLSALGLTINQIIEGYEG